MKYVIGILALVVSVIANTDCGPKANDVTNTIVNGGLTFVEYECINQSSLTDVPAIAVVCGVVEAVNALHLAPELEKFIEALVAQRQAAQAAGFVYVSHTGWVKPPVLLDAGVGAH